MLYKLYGSIYNLYITLNSWNVLFKEKAKILRLSGVESRFAALRDSVHNPAKSNCTILVFKGSNRRDIA